MKKILQKSIFVLLAVFLILLYVAKNTSQADAAGPVINVSIYPAGAGKVVIYNARTLGFTTVTGTNVPVSFNLFDQATFTASSNMGYAFYKYCVEQTCSTNPTTSSNPWTPAGGIQVSGNLYVVFSSVINVSIYPPGAGKVVAEVRNPITGVYTTVGTVTGTQAVSFNSGDQARFSASNNPGYNFFKFCSEPTCTIPPTISSNPFGPFAISGPGKDLVAVFTSTAPPPPPPLPPANIKDICPDGFKSLCFDFGSNPNFFGSILQILIVIAIVLSLIFLIKGGIAWAMSGGDKGKVEQAKSAVMAAIIGLLISLLAYFIVNLIVSAWGGLNLSNLNIPRLID